MSKYTENYHGRISPQSIELGEHTARFCEQAVIKLAAEGEPDERCATCAFRKGTIPNQCVDTLMDATKCVLELDPFYCHDKGRTGHVCFGWYAMVATSNKKPIQVDWKFSSEYEKEKQ